MDVSEFFKQGVYMKNKIEQAISILEKSNEFDFSEIQFMSNALNDAIAARIERCSLNNFKQPNYERRYMHGDL